MTGSSDRPRADHDADSPPVQAGAVVEAISAVTLVTADMARAVGFYEALGFVRTCGGPQAPFTSFAVGGNYLNVDIPLDTDIWLCVDRRTKGMQTL